MKASLETVSTLERKLNIEVPATEVQASFEKAFIGLQKHVAIKGFRKGKAPLATVKQLFRDRVQQDVVQDIIQSNFASALKQHALNPISYPAIEFDPIETEKDFSFSAEFEVRPEVVLKKFENLSVKKEKLNPSDKVVIDALDDIRKGRAEKIAVLEDRPAQKGDLAIIDFIGYIDGGKELENGAGKDHELELGSNSFIPGFEEGVEGMKVGSEKTVSIKFPETYHVGDLAGKPVDFKVNLKALNKKSLPELTEEFVKGLGPYENLEALKTAIKDDYEKRETARINEELKNRLMRVLVDHNPVAVPKSLMAEQKKALIEDFEKRMKQQGMPESQFADYKAKWDSDFERTAAYMIQASFLVDKLAVEQGMKATSADIDTKLAEYAAQTGIDIVRVREFYKEEERQNRLSHQITEEKVLEFLIGKSVVTEVSREEIEKDEPQEA
jgi:trigger factor